MQSKITFSHGENNAMLNQSFLPQKIRIIKKIKKLFIQLKQKLEAKIVNEGIHQALNFNPLTHKVSQGENYRELPYVILDYPQSFKKPDIFSYRCMFWWGHHYSFSLHLEGSRMVKYRKGIFDYLKKQQRIPEELYIALGESAWEYHFEKDNFIQLTKENLSEIESKVNSMSFLKISSHIPANSKPERVIEKACRQFDLYIAMMNAANEKQKVN
jgi:hypothetical protein